MSRRRPSRVPPTFTNKVERLAAVAREHVEGGGIYVSPIAHDDGCPALKTWNLRDCRCEPHFKQPVRLETEEDVREYLEQRGRWAA